MEKKGHKVPPTAEELVDGCWEDGSQFSSGTQPESLPMLSRWPTPVNILAALSGLSGLEKQTHETGDGEFGGGEIEEQLEGW